MHASLRSIGRGCTIVDDESPPVNNTSCDQSDHEYVQPQSLLSVAELVEQLFAPTSASTEEEETHTPGAEDESDQLEDTTTPTAEAPTKQFSYNHSNHIKYVSTLAILHYLDSLVGIGRECCSSCFNFLHYSDQVTRQQCLAFDMSISPFTGGRQFIDRDSTSDRGDECSTNDIIGSRLVDSTTTSTNTLSSLREISEGLRQCSTTVGRLQSKQSSLVRRLSQLPYRFPTTPTDQLFDQLQSTTLNSLLSGHHLVFAGISHLSHSTLTDFTNAELWEIARGIEELDILTRQVQIRQRASNSSKIRQSILLRSSSTYDFPYNSLGGEMLTGLPQISLGYLFTLLARQRSIRLAHSIFTELASFHPPDDKVTKAEKSKPSSNCDSLIVDAFRTFLAQHYNRDASDCLREEYEFISNFIDTLSQATELLAKVQKLKVICSAAAAEQAAHVIPQSSKRPSLSNSEKHISHALSVEGKHGVLMRGESSVATELKEGQDENSSNVPSIVVESDTPSTGKIVKRKVMTKHQETLIRAGTIDRYVATGSVTPPLTTSPNSGSKPDKTSSIQKQHIQLDGQSNQARHDRRPANRSVQWRDQRDVRIRHQVIGRYLELTWIYTESIIADLCAWWPPPILVQADHHQRRHEPRSNETRSISVPGLQQIARQLEEVAKPVVQSHSVWVSSVATKAIGFSPDQEKPDRCDAIINNDDDADAGNSRSDQSVKPVDDDPCSLQCAWQPSPPNLLFGGDLEQRPSVKCPVFLREAKSFLLLSLELVRCLASSQVEYDAVVDEVKEELKVAHWPITVDPSPSQSTDTSSAFRRVDRCIHQGYEIVRRLTTSWDRLIFLLQSIEQAWFELFRNSKIHTDFDVKYLPLASCTNTKDGKVAACQAFIQLRVDWYFESRLLAASRTLVGSTLIRIEQLLRASLGVESQEEDLQWVVKKQIDQLQLTMPTICRLGKLTSWLTSCQTWVHLESKRAESNQSCIEKMFVESLDQRMESLFSCRSTDVQSAVESDSSSTFNWIIELVSPPPSTCLSVIGGQMECSLHRKTNDQIYSLVYQRLADRWSTCWKSLDRQGLLVNSSIRNRQIEALTRLLAQTAVSKHLCIFEDLRRELNQPPDCFLSTTTSNCGPGQSSSPSVLDKSPAATENNSRSNLTRGSKPAGPLLFLRDKRQMANKAKVVGDKIVNQLAESAFSLSSKTSQLKANLFGLSSKRKSTPDSPSSSTSNAVTDNVNLSKSESRHYST